MNKTIGILILCSLTIDVIGGLLGGGDGFYAFAGLSFFVLGISGAILLIKK